MFYQPDEDILYFNERYVNGELQIMFDELNMPISSREIEVAVNQLTMQAQALIYYLTNFLRKIQT